MEKKKLFKGVYNWSFLTIVISAFVLINIIAAFLTFRLDFTEDNRYSLAQTTVEYLSDKSHFTNRISLRIYLEGDLPAEVKRFRNAIEDKLKEFRKYTGNRLEYTFIDPMEGTEADRLELFENLYNKAKGIIPKEIAYQKDGAWSQKLLWPGAEIEYGGSTVNHIQFLPGTPQGHPDELNDEFEQQIQNSINNLEYILISAIRRTTQIEMPRIAFLQGHGELTESETKRVRTLISPYYKTEDVYLNDSIDALKGVKGLVIARPRTPFSEKDKYIIDQFLMRGGRLMCFIDKLYLNQDTLNQVGVTHTTRYNLELDKMLFDYGIKVNDNYVIDAACAPKSIPGLNVNDGMVDWFFDVLATPTSHPISRNIDRVVLRYASQIQFVGNNSTHVATPVLTSSTNSATTGLAPLISLAFPLNYGPKPMLVPNPGDEQNKQCLAGLVEGTFESHFKNRLVDAFAKNPSVHFKEKSTAEGKVFVVGNGTFIQNKYDSVPDGKGGYRFKLAPFNELRFDETLVKKNRQPLIYGNQEFFQNLVDYMMGDNSVLDLRSKQIDIHAIDKVKVKSDADFYRMLNLILPSIIIIIIGLAFSYSRRRKYTRFGMQAGNVSKKKK